MGMDIADLETMIDDLQGTDQEQANCMFQLSLMLARMALSPLSDDFKDHASQEMLELIRAKPKNPTRLMSPRIVTFARRSPWLVDGRTAPAPDMAQVPSLGDAPGTGLS